MAAGVAQSQNVGQFGATERRDAWWLGPLATALGLGLFIHITDNAMIPLKERIVDEFYDPIKKLLRIISPRRK